MKNLMQLDDFLVIDLETTGLGSEAEICEIAIINKAGDTLLHALVKPTRGIPAEATAIHGITSERVAGAASLRELWTGIRAIIVDKPKVAYNAEFEYRIINTELKVPMGQGSLSDWHCAMKAYAKHYGEWNPRFGDYKFQKLTTACKEFGIDLSNAHSALDDARATLEVVKALAAIEEAHAAE